MTTVKTDVTTQTSVSTTPSSMRNVRLPLNFYPTTYDVELQPYMYDGDVKHFYFIGFVIIEMQCRKSTHEIVLHSNKLNITTDSIEIKLLGSGSQPSIGNVEFDKINQFLILTTKEELIAGRNYSVKIEFRGPLIDDLAGLYLSSYVRNNETM